MKYILIILVMLKVSLATAQDNTTGTWIMYFGDQKISSRWNWYNEFQARFYEFTGDLEQIVLRTGIGYDLSENNNNVLMGYAFFHSEPYQESTGEKIKIQENRVYQQWITRQHFGILHLRHRVRVEERFLPGLFKWRFRYALALSVPLTKKELSPQSIYLAAGNEIFLQPSAPAFDRDRVYLGLGYMLARDLKVEAGYMVQLFSNKSRGQIMIGFSNTLPLQKVD